MQLHHCEQAALVEQSRRQLTSRYYICLNWREQKKHKEKEKPRNHLQGCARLSSSESGLNEEKIWKWSWWSIEIEGHGSIHVWSELRKGARSHCSRQTLIHRILSNQEVGIALTGRLCRGHNKAWASTAQPWLSSKLKLILPVSPCHLFEVTSITKSRRCHNICSASATHLKLRPPIQRCQGGQQLSGSMHGDRMLTAFAHFVWGVSFPANHVAEYQPGGFVYGVVDSARLCRADEGLDKMQVVGFSFFRCLNFLLA